MRLYDFYLDDDDNVKVMRRNVKKKKKKPPACNQMKYGIEVPRSVADEQRIDEKNGKTFWMDAIKLEVDTLMDMNCFSFQPKGFYPGNDWQSTTLHMMFDVKHDLRRKSRLVAGGHLVEMIDTHVYSSTVKSISVQLLHVISHRVGLKQLCGDIGNAFPCAYTNEKVYVRVAGQEFGEKQGMVIVIRKELYGLCSSSERFRSHLGDTLRSFGFTPTCFDNDVWIRLDEVNKTYEYICTHVDDFMICSKRPEEVMKEIELVYLVKD